MRILIVYGQIRDLLSAAGARRTCYSLFLVLIYNEHNIWYLQLKDKLYSCYIWIFIFLHCICYFNIFKWYYLYNLYNLSKNIPGLCRVNEGFLQHTYHLALPILVRLACLFYSSCSDNSMQVNRRCVRMDRLLYRNTAKMKNLH